MKLNELKTLLRKYPSRLPRFELPDGSEVPAHFHVTEVGYVTKNFVDCGGTFRAASVCVLQTWVSNDTEHRLDAGKLDHILSLADKLLPHEDVNVEVEYESGLISQYLISEAVISGEKIQFRLASKHTDCLAKEACGLEPSGCCDGEGGCG